jgi:ABC-type Fe3+-hydroxamate transport system substrate-binding protein
LDELLRMAGHENAMASLGKAWGEVSIEAIVRADPEAILEFPSSSRPVPVEEAVAAWRAVGPMKAVESGRVFVFAGQHHTVPGPRVAETLRAMIAALGG